MRILAIRGANIASLESFDVDFRQEPLASAGIFAITGPTGSGKSSLLDAMCLALYHKAPRLEGVSGQEAKVASGFGEIGQDDIRNLIRRGASTGFAETDFLGMDGAGYRARWGYRAGKRSNAAAQEDVSLVRLSDAQVLENKKTDCRDRICSLVGLTYEQFSRTVLLAQGRFAEFLRSREGERAELLEKLTGTDIYSRISKAVYDRKVLEESSRKEIESRLQGIASLSDADRSAKEAELARVERVLPERISQEAAARAFREVASKWTESVIESGAIARALETARPGSKAATEALEGSRLEWTDFQAWMALRETEIREAMVLDSRIEQSRSREKEAEKRHADVSRGLDALRAERSDVETRMRAREAALAEVERFLESRVRLGPVAEDWQQCRTLLELCAKARVESLRQATMAQEAKREVERLAPKEEELTREVARREVELGNATYESLEAGRRVAQSSLEAWMSARELLALDSDERAIQARSRDLERALAAGRERVSSLEQGLVVVRRMLDATRLAASESVDSLRASLVQGEPCPVCGSQEHRFGAGDNHRFHELVLEQAGMVADAEADLKTASLAVAAMEAESVQIAKDLARIAADRLRKGELAEPFRQEIERIPQDDRVSVVAERLDAANAELAVADARLGEFARLGALRQDLNELGRTLDADRNRLRQAELEIERTDGEGRSHAARLDEKFGSDLWRSKWETGPEAYLAMLERQVQDYRAKLQERNDLEVAQGKDRVLLESLGPQIDAKASELDEVLREWQEFREATAEYCRVRAGMLEGASVAKAQEDATRRKDDIASELEKRQTAADALAAEIQRLEGASLRNASERAGLDSRVAQEGPEVAGLADADWDGCIVEGAPDPVRVAALADAAARVCEARAMECRDDQVRIRTELSIDDRAREQVGDLAARLEAQAAIATRWGNLSAAIGSADGKTFRTIAQQYTLEGLLAEANRELSIITPRYSLRMLGESMHFGVVDHDSFGELRPVHTLSGGESFIVSLSLALGLSRMAGGDLAVESLFIDEGFGTLDSDTLRCVMAALSSLHSQGRKVGLITHVEEMKEQIPVRIEVAKLGQGASRIEVRG